MTLQPRPINFEETWLKVEHIVDAVLTSKPISKDEWNECFFDIYHLCNGAQSDNGGDVYARFKMFMIKHVNELLAELSQSGEHLLISYHRHWLQFRQAAIYLNNVFINLNTSYCRKGLSSGHSGGDDIGQHSGVADFPGSTAGEQLLEIRFLCHKIWHEGLILMLSEQLVSAILDDANKDRVGISSHQQLLRVVIESFQEVEAYKVTDKLELYTQIFESRYLIATDDFYQIEVQKMLEQYQCSNYIQAAIRKYHDECARSQRFLHPSSNSKVAEKFYKRIVTQQLDWLNDEVRQMIRREARDDLRGFYRLVKPVNGGLDKTVEHFADYVEQVALDSIKDVSRMPEGRETFSQYIESLMRVQTHFCEFIQDVFDNDTLFTGAMDRVFSRVVNARTTLPSGQKGAPKAPMYLVHFCDSLLKKTSKGLTETDIDDSLNRSLVIFKYIEDKDMYLKWYSQLLSRRLIGQNSISMNQEEEMIKRLKDTCGFEYTRKLQKMIQDMHISNGLNPEFAADLQRTAQKPIDHGYFILVLTAGNWPLAMLPSNSAAGNAVANSAAFDQSTFSTSRDRTLSSTWHASSLANVSAVTNSSLTETSFSESTFQLPIELETCMQQFCNFYYRKFSGRRLTWYHQHSTCELSFAPLSGGGKKYHITTTLYVAAALLLYNSQAELTLNDLCQRVGLPVGELLRILTVLVENRILNGRLTFATPGGIDSADSRVACCDATESFRVNDDYQNKRLKLRLIPSGDKKELQQQQERTGQSVAQDRKLELEAAIVRIMKARKTLIHAELIEEVCQQVRRRFVPSVGSIKQVIEALIEKEYLARDPNQPERYQYIS